MLWYISSVIIYFCIIKSSIKLCKGLLETRNRIEKLKTIPKSNINITLFGICWIPIIRLLVLIILYYITICSDEVFNKIIAKN